MLLYSLIEELCTKEENGKTSRNCNFGHECILMLTSGRIRGKIVDIFAAINRV